MDTRLKIIKERFHNFESLLEDIVVSISAIDRCELSEKLMALFDAHTRDVVFFFEQCIAYQRNLRCKNNFMSNLKTNKNGKK